MPQFDSLDTPLLIDNANLISGGIINNAEAHLLPPNAAAYLLNIQPAVDGRRQKRAGVDAMGIGANDNPNFLGALESPLHSVRVLVGQWGNNIYSSPGNDVWSPRATQVSLYNTYHMGVVGRGATNTASLFLTSCVAASNNVSLPYGNLVCLDRGFSSTEIGGVRARSLAWFQSRLWAFNSCATTAGPDYLLWSNPLDGRNFSNGQNVQVDPDTGDPGVAIVPLRDASPRMLLFKEKSIHLLDIFWTTDGYYTTTANSLDFTKSQLRPITLETGCVATRSPVWVPGLQAADILFLSREGIRSLSRSLTDSQGGAGLPLSYRIQPLIDRINWQTADRSVAAYWNGTYYLAVPIDGNVSPNFVIAYDVFRDAFWFADWEVAGWASAQLTADRKFFFLSHASVTETYASGATNGYHVYQTEVGAVDPGASPIDFDEQTRAFAFDDTGPGTGLAFRKRWAWLDLAVQAAGTNATLTVSYKVDDDNDWTDYSHIGISPADAFPDLPVQLPFTFSSTRMTHKKLVLDPIRPGYKIQFRLRDNTSFARIKILQMALAALPQNTTFD